MKKTVVIGASPNPERYGYLAVSSLLKHGHEVVPLGIKKGAINGLPIINDRPALEGVDTVTLYLNPTNQKGWIDYIIGLKPKRIIFNPGTENPELKAKAAEAGISYLDACTLVMLSTRQY